MKTVLLGSVAALVAAASASAQSIDYATMQDMFGEPVTLGATGAPQRASDAPATMIVITREEIERHPAIDIPDILGRFAGVDTERYTRGQGEVSIRGYNTPYNPRLLVLINGRQVYLDHYGYVNWSALPVQLDEIQQIEVVKGPQAALYGFNAVSGVVNIITRDPTLGDWSTV
ncbi:TonB-dependent receptor plug domain-containing protein, partial [Marinicauda pacifica]|uniref:TonB-dependent receptor plug domain-containing protein n=1 Tax=Marinicauda pacifica TaxID=1133559 RepID=UPI0035C80DB1